MDERRAEHRFDAEGEVCFFFEDPIPHEVTARLLDYSKSGFRAAHDYPALVSGQSVRFQHLLSNGEARVVWNRIVDGQTETGFVILSVASSSPSDSSAATSRRKR